MGDLPYDSIRLTNEAMDRCPIILESMHQYTKTVIEILDEWGFLKVVPTEEDE